MLNCKGALKQPKLRRLILILFLSFKELPAEAPEWLLTLITTENTGAGKASPNKWRELAFKDVAEGERNSSLTALAGHLLRRYVDPYLTLELLLLWNQVRCVPPLPVDEVQGTVDSVAKLKPEGGGCHHEQAISRT